MKIRWSSFDPGTGSADVVAGCGDPVASLAPPEAAVHPAAIVVTATIAPAAKIVRVRRMAAQCIPKNGPQG